MGKLRDTFGIKDDATLNARVEVLSSYLAEKRTSAEAVTLAAQILLRTAKYFPKPAEFIDALNEAETELRAGESRRSQPEDQAALIARLNQHIELKLGRDCMHKINLRWEREEPGEVWLRVHDLHRVRNWFAQFNSMEAWWNANDPFKRRLRLIDDNDVWDDFTPTLGRMQPGAAA